MIVTTNFSPELDSQKEYFMIFTLYLSTLQIIIELTIKQRINALTPKQNSELISELQTIFRQTDEASQPQRNSTNPTRTELTFPPIRKAALTVGIVNIDKFTDAKGIPDADVQTFDRIHDHNRNTPKTR